MDEDLNLAKERLLAATAAYQPLGCVRERPLRYLGASFAAGFLAGWTKPGGGALAVAPILLNALILAQKLVGSRNA